MTSPLGPIVLVAGTRPEILKLAPVHREAAARLGADRLRWISTGQHGKLADETLAGVGIEPSHRLEISSPDLADLAARLLGGLREALAGLEPELVVVQGDTTSAVAAALAARYARRPVAHVEAGLRSFDADHPFPEEANRRMIAALAAIHLAPTASAAANLRAEGIASDRILVTGNTAVDGLGEPGGAELDHPALQAGAGRRILVTLHRRELHGPALEQVCLALRDLARAREDVEILLPVHVNPEVAGPIRQRLSGEPRIRLLDPLPFRVFQRLVRDAFLVLTDSGGVQEEAPSHGTPVLVLRPMTERPEAVERGLARVVGREREGIVRETLRLLDDPAAHAAMARRENPFGDGRASERIVRALGRFLRDEWPLLAAEEQFRG